MRASAHGKNIRNTDRHAHICEARESEGDRAAMNMQIIRRAIPRSLGRGWRSENFDTSMTAPTEANAIVAPIHRPAFHSVPQRVNPDLAACTGFRFFDRHKRGKDWHWV